MTSYFPNRTLIKAIILLIAIGQLSFKGFSQQKQTYNLLWEIKGKSLTKPSYLFGSASFKDRRVFNFSDSVMVALQASAVFVMEDHPDSLVKLAFQQLQNLKALKDLLTPAQTKLIFEQFKNKNGYDADSSLLGNPFQLTEVLQPSHSSATDMPSSVENYLYGIARTLKKKIVGFNKSPKKIDYEDVINQLGNLIDNPEEEDQQGFEDMINVFETGNINDILNFINASYEEGIDFAEQSKEVSNHITSMLNNEGAFFAVNVAYLAGPNGIIALLKKAGYQVRPVNASFTGVAKTYAIDFSKMEWQPYEDKADQFSINFPSNPIALARTGGAKAVGYADATNNVLYTVTSLFTGPLINSTSESYIDTVLNFHSKNKSFDVLNKKKYAKYGTTVLDVDFRKNGKYARMLLVHHNQIYYTISIESKINNLHEPFADLFFNSFKMTAPLTISAADWINHEDKIGAFSLKIPVKAEGGTREVANEAMPDRPYFINMFSASDKANQVNYIFRYNDFPTGMYLSEKKAVFDALTKNIEQNGKIIEQRRTIYKDGYEGCTLSAIVEGMYMEIQIYIRGNRTYVLLLQNMKGVEKPKNNIFFESFRFLPYSSSAGELTTSGNMEITMPTAPLLAKEETNKEDDEDQYTSFLGDSKTISAVNKNTGGAYSIEKSTISKYFRSKDLDSLYNQFIDRLNPNIGAAKAIDVMIGNLKGKEIVIVDSLANTSKKTKLWFQGDKFYYQTLISSKEEIEKGELANIFFSNSRVKTDEPLFDFNSSKAKLIIQDLRSKDTLTYKKALGALSYYKFEKDELPLIYAALDQKYTDDTTSSGARAVLINNLVIVKDDQTTGVLKNLYQQSKNSGVIQSEILKVITQISKDNYDWYLKSLTESKGLSMKDRWDVFRPLTDSISYAVAHLDQILPLMEVEEYRPMILNTISSMLNEKNIASYQALVSTKKNLIVKHVAHDLAEDIKNLKANQFPTTAYSYLAILPVLDSKLTDDFTKQLLLLDSVPYLITEAVVARIKAKLPLDEQLLSAQLANLTSRLQIMQAFIKAGKLTSIPAQYKKLEEVARLILHNYLIEEYEEPKELKYLGTIKEGKDTHFIFDFSYEEDGKTVTYIGLAGPFNTASEALDFDNYLGYSDFEPKSKDWMKQAKKIVKELK